MIDGTVEPMVNNTSCHLGGSNVVGTVGVMVNVCELVKVAVRASEVFSASVTVPLVALLVANVSRIYSLATPLLSNPATVFAVPV